MHIAGRDSLTRAARELDQELASDGPTSELLAALRRVAEELRDTAEPVISALYGRISTTEADALNTLCDTWRAYEDAAREIEREGAIIV